MNREAPSNGASTAVLHPSRLRDGFVETLAGTQPGLRSNAILAGLTGIERDRVFAMLQVQRLRRHQTLFRAGEAIPGLWFPLDAVVSSTAESSDGGEIEVGLFGNEGVTGFALLGDLRISPMTVATVSPGYAAFLPAAAFETVMSMPGGTLVRRIARFMTKLIGCIGHLAACNATHSVEQRIVRRLLMIDDRSSAEIVPFKHETVALLLGVRRATVTTVAVTLRESGAVTYRYGELRIVDRGPLLERVCHCYGTLERYFEKSEANPASS